MDRIEEIVEKTKRLIRCLVKFVGKYLSGVIISCIVAVLVVTVYRKNGGYESLCVKDLVETIKISVTVLISMLGFSVSIYVFLNNSFQSRRSANATEKQIIDKFQKEKRKSLGIRITFAVIAIICECAVVTLTNSINLSTKIYSISEFWLMVIVVGITVANVICLGLFTYNVINYEEGLEKLAAKEVREYASVSDNESIKKGEFLNLVNNVEVLVERLIRNHLHAKVSSKDDSNFKQALCDGVIDAGEINTREEIAGDYRKIIEYRNLLVQNSKIEDSKEVAMGDQVKSVMNRIFQKYLRGELLTGINLSNIAVKDADLEKSSFNDTSISNIGFTGKTNLKYTDFRNSTINTIYFSSNETQCEGINFTNSKLINVQFETNVKLERSVFKNADLTNIGKISPEDKEGKRIDFAHAIFSDANMTGLDICNSCFDYADFSNTRLIDCKIGASALKKNNTIFTYANFRNADLLRAYLERCDFSNANLEQVSFTYALMNENIFKDSRLSQANFTKARIKSCKFEKSYCSNISMKSARIRKSKFDYAILREADMSGAVIKKCQFNDTVCTNTLWVNTQIEESSFKSSVLANARIVGKANGRTRIRKCDFRYANMSNIAITNIEFVECDFTETDFTGARLINVSFIHCKNVNKIKWMDSWLVDVYSGKHGKKLFEEDKLNHNGKGPRHISYTR